MTSRDSDQSIKTTRNTYPPFKEDISFYKEPSIELMARYLDMAEKGSVEVANTNAAIAAEVANTNAAIAAEATSAAGAAHAEREEEARAQGDAQGKAVAQGDVVDMDFDDDGMYDNNSEDDEFSGLDSDDDRKSAANPTGGDALNKNRGFSARADVFVSALWASDVPDKTCSICVSRRISHSKCSVTRLYCCRVCMCVNTVNACMHQESVISH